jgi:hypothetical protein
MKRVFEFIAIIIIMSQLFSCTPGPTIELTFAQSLTNTATPSYTPSHKLSPTLQGTYFPTPKPPPTPQVLENGWNRFTYLEAGYYIDYPPNATLEIDNSFGFDYTEAIIRFPRSVDESGVVMKVFTDLNKENKSLDMFADEEINRIYNGQPPTLGGKIEMNATIISGHSALILDDSLRSIVVFIESKDRYFEILLVPNTMIGNPTTNEAVNMFYKILDTFTIL